MPTLPSGRVTFAFTDIASSTALLKRLGDDAYSGVLATHRRLVRDAFASHAGQEIDTQGDAFFYSFVRARDAVEAAVAVQRAHAAATWPQEQQVHVRIGLHTGEPQVGDEGYTGLDVVRAARIAAIAHGGQTLLSDTTRALVGDRLPAGVTLRALGRRRLKDIDTPEPLHELAIEGLAPARLAEARLEPAGPTRTVPVPARGRRSGPPVPPPPAPGEPPEPPDAEPAMDPDLEPFLTRTREQIEERVLHQLGQTFERGVPGIGDLASLLGPGPGGPPVSRRPRARSLATEIERLRELRDSGALTEEQYARAVDRLLEGGSDSGKAQRPEPGEP